MIGPSIGSEGARKLPAAGVAFRSARDLLMRHVSGQSLATRFLVTSLVVLVLAMAVIGTWVGEQIESGVLNRTASVTALYVDSVITPHLQSLASGDALEPSDLVMLRSVTSEPLLQQHVVAFKVWSPDGHVLFSPDARLVGRQFPIDEGLAQALQGGVAAHVSDLDEVENEYERDRWSRLLEVYAPVREDSGGRVLGSIEFYQLPDELEAEVGSARLRSWGVVALVGLVTYLLLGGIVKRGSDIIVRQEVALRDQVAQLSALLEQNARLHERVRQAGARTTALNEQALRRISADLHDGPGQALALALLRLDSLKGHADCQACGGSAQDFEVVRGAVRDALSETRAISAGLRLPLLAPLSIHEVAERAVRDHERRSGTCVALDVSAGGQAPIAVKIALHRTLQESLSNATRHGLGRDVRAWVTCDEGMLHLRVSDDGPGFVPTQVPAGGHLGLAGMRERAELLEGRFDVSSAPGQGTTVDAWWPLVGEVRHV